MPGLPPSAGQRSLAAAMIALLAAASIAPTAAAQPGVAGSDEIKDESEGLDHFGRALATGDFDGDGRDDMAVGVPGEDLRDRRNVGAVSVLYGSDAGLGPERNQFFNQTTRGVDDRASANDHFGASLTVGRFNDDGYDDLAIGIRGENVDGVGGAGAVQVIYGSPAGLDPDAVSDDQLWTRATADVEGELVKGDHFGASLAAGDLNGDGWDDLAIGAPGDHQLSLPGSVGVIYGSAEGLSATATPDQYWDQDSPDVEDVAEAGDIFGFSLAIASFNGDEFADLAVGAPSEDVVQEEQPDETAVREQNHSAIHAGVAHVLYGTADGLSATVVPDQLLVQGKGGIDDKAQGVDFFGFSLAAGRFNADDYADLAIGAVYEDVKGIRSAGQVHVIYGSATGLDAQGVVADQVWHAATPDVEGEASELAEFGWAVATGRADDGTTDDLAIGAKLENARKTNQCGAVHLLYSGADGLTATAPDDQLWSQRTDFVEGDCNVEQDFGAALAFGSFNQDSFADLAIGVPRETIGAEQREGAVNVLYGSPAGLDPEGAVPDQFWSQDS